MPIRKGDKISCCGLPSLLLSPTLSLLLFLLPLAHSFHPLTSTLPLAPTSVTPLSPSRCYFYYHSLSLTPTPTTSLSLFPLLLLSLSLFLFLLLIITFAPYLTMPRNERLRTEINCATHNSFYHIILYYMQYTIPSCISSSVSLSVLPFFCHSLDSLRLFVVLVLFYC